MAKSYTRELTVPCLLEYNFRKIRKVRTIHKTKHRARLYELIRAPKPHTSKHIQSTVHVGHHSLHICIMRLRFLFAWLSKRPYCRPPCHHRSTCLPGTLLPPRQSIESMHSMAAALPGVFLGWLRSMLRRQTGSQWPLLLRCSFACSTSSTARRLVRRLTVLRIGSTSSTCRWRVAWLFLCTWACAHEYVLLCTKVRRTV